jgi:dTDP-D-glucose 4,6-dehydratase
LTYAGNLENLTDIDTLPNYIFEKGDIVDADFINNLFDKYQFDGVVHLAAESHVDRSITDPMAFVMTNVIGTVNLLNAPKIVGKATSKVKGFIMCLLMRYMESYIIQKIFLRNNQVRSAFSIFCFKSFFRPFC